MRVLFIYPNLFSLYAWSPGIMILSAYLKERGHETDLIHVNNEFGMPLDIEKIVEKARAFKPDVVGITAITFEYPVADRIAAAVKEALPGIPVLLGGTHATIRPDDLASSNFDGFCVGEGEKPLIEFLSRLEDGKAVHETQSFHYKFNGKVVKNPLNPFIKDLDELPFYDWGMLDIDRILKVRDGWLNVMFSRGCPFVCTFCINQALKAIKGFASFNRTKSVAKTMEELKYLASQYKVKVFNFDDDLLMLNRQWMRDFMKRYREEIFEPYGVQYKANTRCDLLTEDFAKELSASGCREIQFGVEAGNEELRNGMLKKALKTEKIIEAFDLCHRHKVNAFAFMILGIPGETRETVREAFQLLARIQPDVLRVSFLTPFFGTPIYDYCKQHDLFKAGSEKGESYFLESGLKFDHITTDELSRAMFLYAWHINAELGHEAYRAAIEKHAFANAAEFQRRWPEILEANKALIKTVPPGKSYYDFFYDHHYFLKRKVCGREEEKLAVESMSEDVLMAVE